MPKMYFAEFERTVPPYDKFNKFGHTGHNDAMIRLNRIVEDYPQFKVRVLAVVYHHDLEHVQEVEERYKAKYPKNFYLSEKISGVTEIVKLQYEVRNNIIQELRALNDKNKKELFD